MKSWSALAILISLALAAPQRAPSYGVEEEEPIRKLGEPGQPQAFQDRPPAVSEQANQHQHVIVADNGGRISPIAALADSAEDAMKLERHEMKNVVKRQTGKASPVSRIETALDNTARAPAVNDRFPAVDGNFPPPSTQIEGSIHRRGIKGVYGYSSGRPADEDHTGGKTWIPCDPEHNPEWKECLRKAEEREEGEKQ
ncbi:hypothetical protein CDD80_6194 [Ophiocordyceps camponoti-rufipedis]|uniref:Uncharacterized protein n=1 Tax=Ophiocordyceps camponoti-rufipedis TaxID=2004952 RepID=A0A2C5ZG30_9HYPO|nr:hypothetical protein CDD80_6194 [Ophiocordyceps camponoti-rufipedis]